MQQQAAVNIDRKIGKTGAELLEQGNTQPTAEKAAVSDFEPFVGKIRKSGAGGMYRINDNLWEGRYTPTNANGKRESHNVYALTREDCEEKLSEMIEAVRVEINEEKAKLNG